MSDAPGQNTAVSDDNGWLAVSSGALTARIDPLGAQLSALRDASGRELLWDGNPEFWNGRAPLLFPIVGTLANGVYRLAGKTYALPRHGFARGKSFRVLKRSASEALLTLKADEETLAVYPFDFQLEVRFEISGSTLTATTRVRNDGHVPMPASFGYHPAFRWPLPFGAARALHAIQFELEEAAPIRRLNSDGLVTPVRFPSPVHARSLPLSDDLFKDDVLIFASIRSRAVTYGAATGPAIALQFPDSPVLGLWTKPGAPFICIEPWHGMSDPVGFTGDFTEKPGVFIVAPNQYREFRMRVTVTSD
jgi:galactose mutarotase-like enzyme